MRLLRRLLIIVLTGVIVTTCIETIVSILDSRSINSSYIEIYAGNMVIGLLVIFAVACIAYTLSIIVEYFTKGKKK